MEQPPLLTAHSLTSVQVKPLPVYPEMQAHVAGPPRTFVHFPVTGAQPPLLVAHSLRSLQVTPLPVKPEGHAPQVLEPAVLVQVLWKPPELKQPPLAVAHSLTSAQVMPLPLYPVGQVQVRDPGILVHCAGGEKEHPPLLVAHSLMSLQTLPPPPTVYPVWH
jgi:hypothetical protein